MKDEVRQILGKRITGVVIKERKGEGHPRGQLFLVFEDGTYYEFYTPFDTISTTGGVCRGTIGDVLNYMNDRLHPVWVGYQGQVT